MCEQCEQKRLGRRALLSAAALGIAAGTGLFSIRRAFAAGEMAAPLSPDQALARLKLGNEKFVGSRELYSPDLAKARARVVSAQAPLATIVSCADSRIPAEMVFGELGIGDLFISRDAGNVIDTMTLGTIEYGAAVLNVPLIVVLGHQNCGAVKAACDAVVKGTTYPGSIGSIVAKIVPAVRAVQGQPGDFANNAARESARRSAKQIVDESAIVSDLVKAGKVKVAAAYYTLHDGRVEFLA